MPRKISGLSDSPIAFVPDLAEKLTSELRSDNEIGQPMIYEQHFPRTNAIRATVIWDEWASWSDEKRAITIIEAYRRFQGEDFSNRIALAIGLSVPEATESGLLPVKITAAWRGDDPVTLEDCYELMQKFGASLLFENQKPHLRFASRAEAEKCRESMIAELPGSDSIWLIEKDFGPVQSWPET